MVPTSERVFFFTTGFAAALGLLAVQHFLLQHLAKGRKSADDKHKQWADASSPKSSGSLSTPGSPTSSSVIGVRDPAHLEHCQEVINSRKASVHDSEDSPIIIAVAGGTGSGKTTLSRAIVERFGEEDVTYINHDFYYKDLSHLTLEQRAKIPQHNFDHPEALDTDLLISHLKLLREGNTVLIPQYNFKTHSREERTVPTKSKKVILLEGILIFADSQLVELLDVKIFVDTPADIRFIRRLRRDISERGRTVESVVGQYNTTVRPMHLTFVEPSKQLADIIIPFGLNRIALDMVVSRLRAYVANSC